MSKPSRVLDLSTPASGSAGWPALAAATEHLDPPFAVLDRGALARNAHDLVARASGLPIRLATKSVRSRDVIDAALALEGFRGVLAFTLPEALWLAESIDDVLLGYPTVDRGAIATLATDERLAARVTLMVDALEQLDCIDAVVPPERRPEIRVAIELDASWRSRLLGHVGSRRSPVHEPGEAAELAAAILRRPGFRLVGMMAYEGQIAGVQDAPPGRPVAGAALRAIQRRSADELRERRAAAVAAVRAIAELEFINGGGTGSLELTRRDASVTEVAAGSGLFGPTLFDGYSRFRPAPAAAFALAVVRAPAPDIVTVLGGGWIASGPPGADRVPTPVWPEGLRMLAREGAGEVQTPLTGPGARELRIGDRVWFRHAKAGEVSEHVDAFVVVDGDRVIGAVPTYRGEGRAFL